VRNTRAEEDEEKKPITYALCKTKFDTLRKKYKVIARPCAPPFSRAAW
jgi:hypothetical protein